MVRVSARYEWPLVGALFAMCLAPTFISYRPYQFSWDDSDYLRQSIQVSRALWSGSVHGLGEMVGIRPPMMALLGWPWGRLTSWNAAGDCFVSLAILTAMMMAFCLYLLLRIGVKPVALLTASACVFVSLGPYPHATSSISLNTTIMSAAAHWASTAFLADNLFAWMVLAALLLIPYAERTSLRTNSEAIVHGIVWGLVLSLGAMTKLDSFYFMLFIVPVLFLITLRRDGARQAFAALGGLAVSFAPAAFYLVRWGGPAFKDAEASSFGGVSTVYRIPPLQFLAACVHDSPGLLISFTLVAGGVIYLVIRKSIIVWSPDFLAVAIIIGFAIIVLVTANRQIRYAFPAIVALPFVTAVLLGRKGNSVPRRSAACAAILAFCTLAVAGAPMRYRSVRQSIRRPDAVLAEGSARHAHTILLATDSPTLNVSLMRLAVEVSSSKRSIECDSLPEQASNGAPVEEDYQMISKADQVIFQDEDELMPRFRSARIPVYERYVKRLGYIPTKVGDDITVYSKSCAQHENINLR